MGAADNAEVDIGVASGLYMAGNELASPTSPAFKGSSTPCSL